MEQKEVQKTGTTTIGIMCKDGIVMAADKRSTAGYMVANKRQKKIVQIADNMLVAQAGLVSDAQLLSKLITAEIKLKDVQTGRASKVKEVANLLASLLYYNIRKLTAVPGIVGFLLGGKDDSGYYLYDLGIDGSVTEIDEFMSDGSGSVFALGVLESLYKKGMKIEEGVDLAVKAINASLKRDIATGNGIDVYTITDQGVKLVREEEINTGIN